MTFDEALDKVKELRATWRSLNGAMYKNVAQGHMQTFLEECIKKFGPRFMECVKRELNEEGYGQNVTSRVYQSERGLRYSRIPCTDDAQHPDV